MRSKKIFVVGGFLLIAIILLASTIQAITPKPQNLCKDFIVDIQKGDSTKSYARFSETAQKIETEEGWKAKSTSLKEPFSGKIKFISDTAVTGSEDRIQYDYTITRDSKVIDFSCVVSSNESGKQIVSYKSSRRL